MNEQGNMGTTGKDAFRWWLEDGVLPGQFQIDDLLDEMEKD